MLKTKMPRDESQLFVGRLMTISALKACLRSILETGGSLRSLSTICAFLYLLTKGLQEIAKVTG
jgi:hypothetical protein